MCVLLVEDESLLRAMVAEELAEGGFKVREAGSGDDASILIAERPAAFNLLVTDLHMPGRLDGIGVARLLRASCPDTPVIYMTGRPDALNGIWPLGTKDVLLRKPFALSDLLAAARRLLGGSSHHPC